MNHKTTFPPPDYNEQSLQTAWKSSTPEPSPQTMARLKAQIRVEADRHAVATPAHNAMYFRRPFLAVAAGLLLLAGAYLLLNPSTADTALLRELTAMEREIDAELYALEATVWDALAELEEESPSNELLLHALTLQMMLWED